jgi:hypothetical protein
MSPLEHFHNDEQSLARLTALGSQHLDPDVRLMARVIARLLAERVCESTEADFRAGMAKGEPSSGIAGTFSRAIADEVLGHQEDTPAGSVIAAGEH